MIDFEVKMPEIPESIADIIIVVIIGLAIFVRKYIIK